MAGVAEAAAITGSDGAAGDEAVRSVRGAVAEAFGKLRSSLPAAATTEAAGDATATGVSTVGDNDGEATAGISDGADGLPAATDSFNALVVAGAGTPEAGSLVAGAIASPSARPALGAGEANASVVSPAFALPRLLAEAVSGIGLGSIAGLASVCADATTAASVDGPGDPPAAGLCNQPTS